MACQCIHHCCSHHWCCPGLPRSRAGLDSCWVSSDHSPPGSPSIKDKVPGLPSRLSELAVAAQLWGHDAMNWFCSDGELLNLLLHEELALLIRYNQADCQSIRCKHKQPKSALSSGSQTATSLRMPIATGRQPSTRIMTSIQHNVFKLDCCPRKLFPRL